MSFQFKRIWLRDWLVYGGEATIDLPDYESGRNLVVLNGQNGSGKTSLLRALTYVFRGLRSKGAGMKDELLELWNDQARNHKKEWSLEVGLEFVHGGRACTIVRGADFKPWGSTTAVSPWIKLFVNGKEETDQVDDKIELMLPRDCLEFVFFDGAEISRYAQKQHEEGVRGAIEKVLGIPAVRNLRDDLKKLSEDLEDEQQTLMSQSKQAEQLLSDVQELKDQMQQDEANRLELVEKRKALEKTREEIEREAKDIQEIEKERDELNRKEDRLGQLADRLANLEAQIRGAITQAPLGLLKNSLEKVVEDMVPAEPQSFHRPNWTARITFLNELVEEERCLCGRTMDEGLLVQLRHELQQAEDSLASLPREDGASSRELTRLRDLLRKISVMNWDYGSLMDKRAAMLTEREELESDISRLRGELQRHEVYNVKEIFQRIKRLSDDINELEFQIRLVNSRIDTARSTLLQKQRQLDEIAAASHQARGVTCTLTEVRRVHKTVSALVEELVRRKREDIQASATEVFRQITNKPEEYDRLRLISDYSLEVVRKDGTTVEHKKLSAGEKEVVAYSFITALNLSSLDPAPFVMDTPFGHLDSDHRSGLLRSLPRLHVQAILLATDRDLPKAERDKIDRSIAKEFELKRDQRRAITTIEEF